MRDGRDICSSSEYVNIAAPLKNLISFCRSLEMSLINCKFESNSKWTNHYVLAAACIENPDTNSNSITFNNKGTKSCVLFVKNYQNCFPKDLKDYCIRINTRINRENKVRKIWKKWI